MVAFIYRRGGWKANRVFAAFLVLIFHGIFFVFLLGNTPASSLKINPAMKLVQLIPEDPEKIEFSEPSVANFTQHIYLTLPDIEIDFIEQNDAILAPTPPDIPYELPDPSNAKYPGVFDPKMRQKLLDAQRLNRPRAKEKPESWTEADGRTFVDMGNGDCLVSMQKLDSRERGTSWGHTRCGKSDSEKMMDRVMADVESRKSQSRN